MSKTIEVQKESKIKLLPTQMLLIAAVLIILVGLVFLRSSDKTLLVENITSDKNTRSPVFEAKINNLKTDDFFKQSTKPVHESAYLPNEQKKSSSDDIKNLIAGLVDSSNPVEPRQVNEVFSKEEFMAAQKKALYTSISSSGYAVVDHTVNLDDSLESSNETKSMRVSKGGSLTNGESVLSMGSVIKVITRSENNNHYLGSPFFGVVADDVYDFDRSKILINKGATVVGKIDSLITTNPTIETKLGVVVSKIKRSDGSVVEFDLPASNSDGLGGIDGDVNKHSFRKWGGFGAFAVLSAGFSLNAGSNETAQSSSDDAYSRMKSELSSNASLAASQFLSIKPTITLHSGDVLSLMIVDDVYLTPLGDI